MVERTATIGLTIMSTETKSKPLELVNTAKNLAYESLPSWAEVAFLGVVAVGMHAITGGSALTALESWGVMFALLMYLHLIDVWEYGIHLFVGIFLLTAGVLIYQEQYGQLVSGVVLGVGLFVSWVVLLVAALVLIVVGWWIGCKTGLLKY